jgi:hypothetical protein
MIFPSMTLFGLIAIAFGIFIVLKPESLFRTMSWSRSPRITGVQMEPIPGTRFVLYKIVGAGFILAGVYWVIKSLWGY